MLSIVAMILTRISSIKRLYVRIGANKKGGPKAASMLTPLRKDTKSHDQDHFRKHKRRRTNIMVFFAGMPGTTQDCKRLL